MRSSASVLADDLLQDGAISAGALIALLVPITWYGSVTRRREREARAAGRDLAGADDGPAADPLLKYFGPQPAGRAPGGPGRVEPRFQSRPALAGRSTLSPAFAARQMLPAPHTPTAPPAASPPASPAGPAPAAWVIPDAQAPGQPFAGASGPGAPPAPPSAAAPRAAYANRGGPGSDAGPDAWTGAADEYGDSSTGAGITGATAPTLRRAPVSGAPPWEPAPRPTTSELQWIPPAGPRGPGRSGRPGAHEQAQPAEPGLEAGAGHPAGAEGPMPSAPRSVFDPQPGRQARPAAPGARRQRGDTESRPIYTWNPEGESA